MEIIQNSSLPSEAADDLRPLYISDDDDLSLLLSKACFGFEFIQIMASTFNSDESLSSTEAKTCKYK